MTGHVSTAKLDERASPCEQETGRWIHLDALQQLQVAQVASPDERFLGRVEVESVHRFVRQVVPVAVRHSQARHRVRVPEIVVLSNIDAAICFVLLQFVSV